VVVLLLLVPVAKLVRRRRRRGGGASWSGVYVAAWQEVLDTARDLGTPVPDRWSRLAQATALGTGIEQARRADAVVFAPVPGPREDGRAFWEECQQLRRGLLAAASPRRRWRSHLNPASLVSSWARSRALGRGSARQQRHEDRRAGREQPART
jgi:hypothetical protein